MTPERAPVTAKTEAWLIRMSDGTRFIHGHNAIGDYRAIDPGATVVELVPRAALSAPAVPPGYVLVPVEPTPEMRAAFHGCPDDVVLGASGSKWAAMLAAAPSAKDQPTKEQT